jgi:hypothetical protein
VSNEEQRISLDTQGNPGKLNQKEVYKVTISKPESVYMMVYYLNVNTSAVWTR